MGENYRRTAEDIQSLLGAIRQRERTISRQLAAAREAAATEIEKAEERAKQSVIRAAEDGRLEGEAARRRAMKEIETEAAVVVAQAEIQAEKLRNLEKDTLDSAVNQAVEFITNSK